MNREKLINFLRDHAVITFDALPEETEIVGNCSAIDEETDKQTALWIFNELNSGNIAAWFCARVRASYRQFEEADYLGCCSYASLDEFISEKDGYYSDMVSQAIEKLADHILEAKATIDQISE